MATSGAVRLGNILGLMAVEFSNPSMSFRVLMPKSPMVAMVSGARRMASCKSVCSSTAPSNGTSVNRVVVRQVVRCPLPWSFSLFFADMVYRSCFVSKHSQRNERRH